VPTLRLAQRFQIAAYIGSSGFGRLGLQCCECAPVLIARESASREKFERWTSPEIIDSYLTVTSPQSSQMTRSRPPVTTETVVWWEQVLSFRSVTCWVPSNCGLHQNRRVSGFSKDQSQRASQN